jgi:hypothetical protein
MSRFLFLKNRGDHRSNNMRRIWTHQHQNTYRNHIKSSTTECIYIFRTRSTLLTGNLIANRTCMCTSDFCRYVKSLFGLKKKDFSTKEKIIQNVSLNGESVQADFLPQLWAGHVNTFVFLQFQALQQNFHSKIRKTAISRRGS